MAQLCGAMEAPRMRGVAGLSRRAGTSRNFLRRFLHFGDNQGRLFLFKYPWSKPNLRFREEKKEMTRNIRILVAMALLVLAFALTPSAAKAQSYTGNYPVAVTQNKGGIAGTILLGNVSFCLELVDDGDYGRPHSGTATLGDYEGGTLTGGEFYVLGNMIFVNFSVGSDNGEAVGLVLFAPASNGKIGAGIFGDTGGVPTSGLAKVGAQGGC
jgi:hypothetical protein